MSAFRNLIMTGLPVYTVTFDYGDIPAQQVKKNRLAVRPAIPYREGHDFTGWFINGVLFDFDTPVTGDMALTAGWNLKTFTVSFDTGGGNAVAPQIVAWGNRASYVPCTRDNYEFTGWTLNGTAFDFNTPVTGDMTLTAQWARALYTQNGTATIRRLSGTSKAGTFGVAITFPQAFAEVVSSTINGSSVGGATLTGLTYQTGMTYQKYNRFEETTETAHSGQTSGTVSWTATGYMI